MAKINEAVMEMVQSELQNDPDTSSTDLYDKARKMNRAIGRLSLRQFHARYPLQVKRLSAMRKRKRSAKQASPGRKPAGRRTGAKKTRTSAAKTDTGAPRKRGRRRATSRPEVPARGESQDRSSGARSNVQEVLLQFAGVVATADKADMVQLMLRMDNWVDRVMEAAG
jgi:hypothetical protein